MVQREIENRGKGEKCSTPTPMNDDMKSAFLSAALNQTDYQERYDNLAARYDKLKKEITELSDRIQEIKA